MNKRVNGYREAESELTEREAQALLHHRLLNG